MHRAFFACVNNSLFLSFCFYKQEILLIFTSDEDPTFPVDPLLLY